MTNAVTSVGIIENSAGMMPAEKQACLTKPANESVSVFQNPEVKKENNTTAVLTVPKIPDVKKSEKPKQESNSFIKTFNRILKGAVNGIKNTFGFAFSCPPMAIATCATVAGISVASHAVLGITLAVLAGAAIGAVLSGITNEFSKKPKE